MPSPTAGIRSRTAGTNVVGIAPSVVDNSSGNVEPPKGKPKMGSVQPQMDPPGRQMGPPRSAIMANSGIGNSREDDDTRKETTVWNGVKQRLAVESTMVIQSGFTFPVTLYYVFNKLIQHLAKNAEGDKIFGIDADLIAASSLSFATVPFLFYYVYLKLTGQLGTTKTSPQFTGNMGRKTARDVLRYKLAAQYFDQKMIKASHDVEYQARQQFLIACHPHGVFALSAVLGLSSNGAGFDDDPAFSHLDVRFGVAELPFLVPVMREIALVNGAISPSGPAIQENFRRGRSVGLIVGGADEAGLTGTADGTMRLVLKDRKGFLKQAMRADVDVLPILQLGENALYKQVSLTWYRRFQLFQRRRLQTNLPLVFRKDFWKLLDVFNLTGGGGLSLKNLVNFVGLSPAPNSKLRTIIGPPFDVSRYIPEEYLFTSSPSASSSSGTSSSAGTSGSSSSSSRTDFQKRRRYPENIDKVLGPEKWGKAVDAAHAAYLEAVRTLHAEYAPIYGTPEDQKLEFLDIKYVRSVELASDVQQAEAEYALKEKDEHGFLRSKL